MSVGRVGQTSCRISRRSNSTDMRLHSGRELNVSYKTIFWPESDARIMPSPLASLKLIHHGSCMMQQYRLSGLWRPGVTFCELFLNGNLQIIQRLR